MIPEKLQRIIEDFQLSEGREKLELLLEYAQNLPPLPDRFKAHPEQMEQVHECMSPVFVQAEVEDNRLYYYFDVPPESPTVRGYAAIMASALNGLTPQEILAIPADFYFSMGLQEVLSHQRLNGITAILAYMKRLALILSS